VPCSYSGLVALLQPFIGSLDEVSSRAHRLFVLWTIKYVAVQRRASRARFPGQRKRRCGLKAVQVIRGALRMGRGGEYCPLVALQDLIRRVILADLRGDFEIGTQERRAELRDEFLDRIAFIAPGFRAEVAGKTVRMLRPMRHLVGQRRIVFLRKASIRRDLDVIGVLRIECAHATLADVGAGGCDAGLSNVGQQRAFYFDAESWVVGAKGFPMGLAVIFYPSSLPGGGLFSKASVVKLFYWE